MEKMDGIWISYVRYKDDKGFTFSRFENADYKKKDEEKVELIYVTKGQIDNMREQLDILDRLEFITKSAADKL